MPMHRGRSGSGRFPGGVEESLRGKSRLQLLVGELERADAGGHESRRHERELAALGVDVRVASGKDEKSFFSFERETAVVARHFTQGSAARSSFKEKKGGPSRGAASPRPLP